MAKYVCQICGYIYDEDKEKVKFNDLPDNWHCPLCGASKQSFLKQEEASATQPKKDSAQETKSPSIQNNKPNEEDKLTLLSNAEMSILCTNLAKGCEKQYRSEEMALFNEIAAYYKLHCEKPSANDYDSISKKLSVDLELLYPNAVQKSKDDSDRGALRALTWSEKVSRIVNGLIERYKSEGASFLKETKIYVCEICGFVYIGNDCPDICPICKVPKLKIHEIVR